MRVADKMAYNQVNRAVGKNRSEMAELQNQAATQKRVTKPSEDPVAAARVLGVRIDQRGNEQFVKNLNYAKSFLDYTEQSLNELSEVIVRAKELALSQANDASSNAQSRRIVATEVQQLHDQSVQIANRKLGERFIFGGFKTAEAPFDKSGRYFGDEGEMKIHIDKESFLSMNMPGSIVFQGKGLSKDGFVFKSLDQPHTVHEMNVQKDENPERYLHQDQNLAQKVPPKQIVQRGPASLTTTENMAPVENTEEKPTPEREEFVRETDRRSVPEGENVFHTLKKLEVALYADDKAAIQDSIDRIDDTLQQVIVARTSLGARVTNIENTLNSMHVSIVDNKSAISQLEDADAFQVISDINKTESALQATLQTSGKLMQKSLMDFIS